MTCLFSAFKTYLNTDLSTQSEFQVAHLLFGSTCNSNPLKKNHLLTKYRYRSKPRSFFATSYRNTIKDDLVFDLHNFLESSNRTWHVKCFLVLVLHDFCYSRWPSKMQGSVQSISMNK
jgi:hypothetical protein